jgi:hypothetical protein
MKIINYGLLFGIIGSGISFGLGYFDQYINEASLFIKANKLRNSLAEQAISSYRLEESMQHFVAEPFNKYYDVDKHYKELTRQQQSDVNIIMSALHHEAIGEDIEGIVAVAYSIYNRKNSDNFPDTFYGVITQKMNVKGKIHCQYSFHCDSKSDSVPFTSKYNALKKIAIYTVLGKLDSLADVPMAETKVINGKTYINNYALPINRHRTIKARNSLNYATLNVIRSKKDKYFYDLVYGKYKNQTIVNVIGNHAFITAKPNTQLASLL